MSTFSSTANTSSTTTSTASGCHTDKNKSPIDNLKSTIGQKILDELGVENSIYCSSYLKNPLFYDAKNQEMIFAGFTDFLLKNDYLDRSIILNHIVSTIHQQLDPVSRSERRCTDIKNTHHIFKNICGYHSTDSELHSSPAGCIEKEFQYSLYFLNWHIGAIKFTPLKNFRIDSKTVNYNTSIGKISIQATKELTATVENRFETCQQSIELAQDIAASRKNVIWKTIITTILYSLLSIPLLLTSNIAYMAVSAIISLIAILILYIFLWTAFSFKLLMLLNNIRNAWKKYSEIPQFLQAIDHITIKLDQAKKNHSKICIFSKKIDKFIKRENSLKNSKSKILIFSERENFFKKSKSGIVFRLKKMQLITISQKRNRANQALEELMHATNDLVQTELKTKDGILNLLPAGC